MQRHQPPHHHRRDKNSEKRFDWRRFWNLYKGGLIGFLIFAGGVYLMMALGILQLK